MDLYQEIKSLLKYIRSKWGFSESDRLQIGWCAWCYRKVDDKGDCGCFVVEKPTDNGLIEKVD